MVKLNVKNRTIFCHDNLPVMEGINTACIDLIYLDPPFNKNKKFVAPITSSAKGAEFSDIFREEDVKDEWLITIKRDEPEIYEFLTSTKAMSRNNYNYCYLCYMAIRLIECRRILKDTGSIYLHCDPTMSHYLKIVMDCIFGEKRFRNEITWKRSYSHNDSKKFGRVSDRILFYSYQPSVYIENIREPLDSNAIKARYTNEDERGLYMTGPLHAKSLHGGGYDYDFHGKRGPWKYKEETLLKMEKEGRIHFPKRGDALRKKIYLTEHKGTSPTDIWVNVKKTNKDLTGYPTQKPRALLERIIKASSNKGDMVLDPFCGCATTCEVAELLGRKWIGIDVSNKARDLIKIRLDRATRQGELEKGKLPDIEPAEVVPPTRSDEGMKDGKTKFVYVISNKAFKGEYKVGVASDVKRRLSSYQTSDPDRGYKEEFKISTLYFNEIEEAIHNSEKFISRHEWVRGDLKKIISEIKSLAKKGNSGKLI